MSDKCKFHTLKLSPNGRLKRSEFLYIDDNVSVGIHDKTDEMIVETDNFNVFIKIKYCPMCGQILESEDEE